MTNYQEMYKNKLVLPEEAILSIRSGNCVTTSQCANEPSCIFDNLGLLRGREKNIIMYAPMCFKPHQFLQNPDFRDTFIMNATFLTGETRKSHDEGYIGYYPSDLHSGPARWLSAHPIDVFIGAVSPMDSHGYFTMPLCLIHERMFMDNAKRVILEVNPNLPRVYGDTEVHIRDVDMIVEAETPLPYLEAQEPTETEKIIGGYVSTLVKDGDTIQLGIGGVPDAAAHALMDKHDLGIHTEMITNAMADLIDAGVVTGKRKTLYPGKVVGTFAYGNQHLYDLMNKNPSVRILRGEHCNDPRLVAQNDNFISINSCVSVDLTGQICSEAIGSRQYSGSGGQVDMAIAADHSKGGKSIIAVASTKKNGTISTITSQLEPGSIVTLSRNNVDCVVTEYGIAWLKGRSIRQRVENLISVAHPDFRGELRRSAEKYRLW